MIGPLDRLGRRISGLLGIGVTTSAPFADAGPVQKAQIELGRVVAGGSHAMRDDTPVMHHFGFSSNAPPGASVVVAFLGGDHSNGVIIASNHEHYRQRNLQPGEAAVSDQWGNSIILTQAGIIITHTDKVRISAPLLEVTGDIVDNCDANSATLKQLRDAFDDHRHTGVAAGGASTGPTDHSV